MKWHGILFILTNLFALIFKIMMVGIVMDHFYAYENTLFKSIILEIAAIMYLAWSIVLHIDVLRINLLKKKHEDKGI